MTWATWNACGLLVIGLYAAFSLMTTGDAVSGAWLGACMTGGGTYLELRMSRWTA